MIAAGVGNQEAQERFIARYAPFIEEDPHLRELLTTSFVRNIEDPPADHLAHFESLFEDECLVQRVVFYLGWICIDDFGEITVLAGNGRGIGALKILRGMYERVVTAFYLAKVPAEARNFILDEAFQNGKLWNNALKVN